MSAYLLRFFQSVMSGYLSAIHCGTNQPIRPSLPVLPASWTDFWSVDVLLDQVLVTPVLDHRVDGAVGHALPADLLLDLRIGHRAAQLLLGDLADHVGVRHVAGPRVDRDPEVAAVAASRGLGVADPTAPARGQAEADDRRESEQPRAG